MKSPVTFLTILLAVAVSTGSASVLAANSNRPNVVLILADDMGFSDLGCYGSEIFTPNLDRLARQGVRFTQFYNAARCCPTRAALMTGAYPHQVAVGHMTQDLRRPGYRGDLSNECVTLAEVMRAAGYQTLMCGKWHLTRHTGPEGPKYNWPPGRGFEKFFGTLEGGGSYFDPISLTRDNQFCRATDDFYYTEAISEHAGDFIEKAGRSQKPFFLYVAYTAPHWPLHARAEDIARYKGKYSRGWDEVRAKRHRQMIDLGIVRAEWPLTPRDSRVDPWNEVPYKPWHERRMEAYAAQIDSLDRGVGRILEKLEQAGARENTLILFLSDNGGCAEEIAATWRNPIIPARTRSGDSVQVGNSPNVLPGPENTFQSYGTPWANVSNTPFRLYKHWVHEGGIATPLIAYWPGGIKKPGRLTHQVGHVVDIMATCIDLAATAYPTISRGYRTVPLEGESLMPILRGQSRERSPILWEHEGNRAMRDGKWKLVSKHPGEWELYDMEADRTEMNNVAAKNPDVVESMSRAYEAWAKRSHVEPWAKISSGGPARKPAPAVRKAPKEE